MPMSADAPQQVQLCNLSMLMWKMHDCTGVDQCTDRCCHAGASGWRCQAAVGAGDAPAVQPARHDCGGRIDPAGLLQAQARTAIIARTAFKLCMLRAPSSAAKTRATPDPSSTCSMDTKSAPHHRAVLRAQVVLVDEKRWGPEERDLLYQVRECRLAAMCS